MKYLLLVSLLLAPWSVNAEEEKEEKKRTCRIIYLMRDGDDPTEAYFFDGHMSHKVQLPTLNFSEVIELPTGNITVGMSPESVDVAAGFPDGAPTVAIPEQMTDVYLLLHKDPENKIFPIKMRTLNIDDKNLKTGQTLWINLSSHTIATQMGEEKIVIPPKKISISSPPLKKSGYFLAQFAYQKDSQGPFLPVMKKSWWFDATSKNLGFIVDTGARMPKIFTVRDRRQ
jgi:hypothetical protein